ncbi:MAG: sigma-70 family RNA polymerase sigma factor [Anaerolineae bacterium]|nr:sigma-70 family RNA polymerase sigma factor [Anaerolineae bacterium]
MPAPVAQDEWRLVTQAQRGDQEAFGELIRRNQEQVIGLVYRLCGDMELAEDAAQEAFLRAWQHLPSYRPDAPFKNWLYRIAANIALSALRRERAMTDIDDLLPAASDEEPEDETEASERREYVRRAVLALPAASRAVLVLREYEGLSYREIAEVLNIPIGTVMSRLNYARSKLRESLAPYLQAEGE